MISSTFWNLFHWKTTALPAAPILKAPFSIRQAQAEEKEVVRKVALLAINMNTEWHDATTIAMACIEKGLKSSFENEEEPSCLVLTNGLRIIGVSILDVQADSKNHLVSGPWILTEYRNRGLGSALLYASLQRLAQNGVTEVSGITRGNTTAARFVYPKFGSMMTPSAAPIISAE